MLKGNPCKETDYNTKGDMDDTFACLLFFIFTFSVPKRVVYSFTDISFLFDSYISFYVAKALKR